MQTTCLFKLTDANKASVRVFFTDVNKASACVRACVRACAARARARALGTDLAELSLVTARSPSSGVATLDVSESADSRRSKDSRSQPPASAL